MVEIIVVGGMVMVVPARALRVLRIWRLVTLMRVVVLREWWA